MSKTRPTRRLRGIVPALVAAGLVLSGCAGATPGVAAVIGDEELSMARVDDATQSMCTSITEGIGVPAQAGSQTLPMGFVRQGVVQLLALRVQAEQIAEAYGLEPGPSYERERSRRQQTARSLPEEAREDYVDVMSANAYALSILEQVGREVLAEQGVEDPSIEEVQQAGSEVFTSWPAEHGLEIDPRYGLEFTDGQLVPTDTSLSVPVSEAARKGLATEIDPAYASSLPANLRCG